MSCHELLELHEPAKLPTNLSALNSSLSRLSALLCVNSCNSCSYKELLELDETCKVAYEPKHLNFSLSRLKRYALC